MRLGHAKGQLIVAQLRVKLDPPLRQRTVVHTIGTVDLSSYSFDLLLDGVLQRIQEPEIGRFLAGGHHRLGELLAALAPVSPHVAQKGTFGTRFHRQFLDQLNLRVGVVGEAVDRYHHGDSEQLGILNMLGQVDGALLQSGQVLPDQLSGKRLPCHHFAQSTMHLQGSNGGHDHDAIGSQARVTALDVEELLHPTVGSEAALGDHVVGQFQRDLIGDDGAVAMGDVSERPSVHEGRVMLQGLHERGLDSILQKDRHSTGTFQILGGHRLAVIGHADHDATQSLPEVKQAGGEGQNGHDLGGNRDVIAGLTRTAISSATQPDHDVPQGTIRDIHHAAPGDGHRIDV